MTAAAVAAPARMPVSELRPRSALEMADAAVAAARRWFAPLASVSLLFAAPAAIIGWSAIAVSWPAGAVVAVAAGTIGAALAHAACVDVVCHGWLGEAPPWRVAARRTVRRSLSIVGVWALGGLRVLGGALLCVVPGLVAALGLVPAIPVLLLEPAKGGVIKRAARLSDGRRDAHLAMLVVLGVLVVAMVVVVIQPVLAAAALTGGRDAPALVAVAVAQLAVIVLAIPLAAGATTAAYLDARVRKEGLDLLYLLALIDDVPAGDAVPA